VQAEPEDAMNEMNETMNETDVAAAAPIQTSVTGEPVPADHRKRKRGRRLHSLVHVRTMLAATLRRLEAWPEDGLQPAARIARSRTLIYGASVMGELVKSAEIEQRLRELEEIVRSGRH
jgi:hypothetical protein